MPKSSAPPVPLRILVVDDDPAILNVWRRILGPKWRRPALEPLETKPLGAAPPAVPPEAELSIDTASHGMEGHQKVISALAEARPYTFALVDMRMPGWDGLETILRMLEKDPRLEVAICSAFSDISREEVIQRVGRSDMQWLKKPFDLEVAREMVRKLIDLGTRRRQSR